MNHNACLKLTDTFSAFASCHAYVSEKGVSREGTIRSPSAMSSTSTTGSVVQVRLRQPGMQKKHRPTSIAVSGMSQSMYEHKSNSAASTPSGRWPPRSEIVD